jgi:hypothetical protein
MKYLIVILSCLNIDPSKCTDEYVQHVEQTLTECQELISTVNWNVTKHPQGTHVRPICRKVTP